MGLRVEFYRGRGASVAGGLYRYIGEAAVDAEGSKKNVPAQVGQGRVVVTGVGGACLQYRWSAIHEIPD